MNIVKISDGLGNQMFQYAFARKLQMVSNQKVCMDARFINHEENFKDNGSDCFHEKCGYREYGLNHFKIVIPEADVKVLSRWDYIFQSSYLNRIIYYMSVSHIWPWRYRMESRQEGKLFETKKYVFPSYFEGYFFDKFYFDDIRHLLRKEFCVRNPIRISAELNKILKRDNTVGIHVRKGDFTKLSRDISGTSYYVNALKEMKQNVADPVYLIFSDDINWVRENLKIDGERIYISDMGFEDYEEFTIMKHCKNNIIANSTFSFWAAYLNNNPKKIVICPKRWKINIIPKEWIKV